MLNINENYLGTMFKRYAGSVITSTTFSSSNTNIGSVFSAGDQIEMLMDDNNITSSAYKKGDILSVIGMKSNYLLEVSAPPFCFFLSVLDEGIKFKRYVPSTVRSRFSGYSLTSSGCGGSYGTPIVILENRSNSVEMEFKESKEEVRCECGAHAVNSNNHQNYCKLYSSSIGA